METPIFTLHDHEREGWSNLALFFIAIMAFLSAFLLIGAWIAFSVHPSGVLIFALAVWFLHREGLLDWIQDLRAYILRGNRDIRRAVEARSVAILREAVLSPTWDAFLALGHHHHDHVRFVWTWSADGLAASEIHLFSKRGLLHIPLATSELLGHTPAIGWDEAVLRRARAMRATLQKNRFGPALLSIGGPIPRGSAHARLSLRAWAQDRV